MITENQYYPSSSKTIIDKIDKNDNDKNNSITDSIKNMSFDPETPFTFSGFKI